MHGSGNSHILETNKAVSLPEPALVTTSTFLLQNTSHIMLALIWTAFIGVIIHIFALT